MRTALLTCLLFIFLALPALAEEEAVEAVETEAVEEVAAPEDVETVVDPETMVGPFGSMELTDGTIIEMTELERFIKYYIYMKGKLDGRASTVVSLTRLSDLRRWKKIFFKDQHTFIVTTRQDKELVFTDANIYLGNTTWDTFKFITINTVDYNEEPIIVKKATVRSITINQPRPE